MGTMIASGSDVVGFIKEQHEEVKRLFAEVKASRGKARATAFTSLRRLLAVHETAEEEVVHPVARRALADGEAIIERRLTEEREAKEALSTLEELDVDSIEFETSFAELEKDVVAHAEAEEREELSRLAGALDQSKLERMQKAVDFAEKVAPTHPHPGVESRAKNLLVGPFASMVDRVRDAIAH